MEKKKRKKKKTMSTEEYKELCVKKHGNTYILNTVEYISMKDYVYPICKKHSQFKICAYDFAHLRGCPRCGREGKKKTPFKAVRRNMKFDEFKIIAEQLHDYKYKYIRNSFVNLKAKMKIICPIHGEFEQPPHSHLNGHGCEKCGIIKRSLVQTITNADFINKCTKVHNGYYDYTQTKYIGCYNNVDVVCPKHGLFTVPAYSHLQGHGCKKCATEKNALKLLKPLGAFIEDAKKKHPNGNSDYSQVKYLGAKVPIEIICQNGHHYWQKPNKHLSGHSCPYCAKIVSSYEIELQEFLKSIGISFETSNRKTLQHSKELDIYVPSHKFAIEFNGLYWHSSNKRDILLHLSKTEECEQNGIRLMHIFEDEWIKKKDVVKSQIREALGNSKNNIDINQCVVAELNKEEVKHFINDNSLKDYTKSSVCLGLLCDNVIVSTITFLNVGNNNYKITHYCNKLDTKINDSLNIMLEHFKEKYNPSEIIIDVDRHFGTDYKSYTDCGFERYKILPPICYYIKKQTRILKNSMNEELPTIYDCGSIRYKLKINGKENIA